MIRNNIGSTTSSANKTEKLTPPATAPMPPLSLPLDALLNSTEMSG
ncbi:MAG TPA: hypothetical protein VK363_02360 [Pyrinomonadaceae bacterium]|nr:hypothetical protein [Pyrinomonadaceae bacterium]